MTTDGGSPTAVTLGSQVAAETRERRWRHLPPVLIGVAAVAALVLTGLNAWVRASPPVAEGSVVVMLGDGGHGCDATVFGGDPSSICYEVPFAEGAGVGVGFTVLNTAPIPMTIVGIAMPEPPFLAPAYFHAELVDEDGPYEYTFGLENGRPFEPIEVAPNEEAPLQLVGTFLPCEEAAASHVPGSALIIDHVPMTLRWGIVGAEVDVPLRAALSVPAPDSCPGA